MKLLSGIATDVLFSIIAILLNIVSIPIYINNLGLENYGLWIALSSLVALIGIIDFSADPHLMKMSSDDQIFLGKKWSRYVRKIVILKLISATVILIYIICLCHTLTWFLDININNVNDAKVVIMLCGISAILGLVNGYFTSVLYARGAQVTVNLLNGLTAIATAFCGMVLVVLGFGIIGIAIGFLFSGACTVIFAYLTFKKYDFNPTGELGKNELNDPSYVEILKYLYNFQLLKMIFIMRVNGFPVILASYISLEFSGYYSILSKIPQLVTAITLKINNPFFPFFSQLISRSSFKDLTQGFYRLTCLQCFISIFAFLGFLTFLPIFLPLWANVKVESNSLLILVSVYFALQIIFSPFYNLTFATGEYQKGQFFVLLEMLSLMAMMTLFIFVWAAEGAILALLLSGLITQVYLTKCALNYLRLSVFTFLSKVFKKTVPFTLIPIIIFVYFLIKNPLNTHNNEWSNFLISVVVFAGLSILPILVLIYKHGSASKALEEKLNYEH